jgi:hypothetical protein
MLLLIYSRNRLKQITAPKLEGRKDTGRRKIKKCTTAVTEFQGERAAEK